jgi:pimeloyl-ACP methyl ester carboxylesterase
MPDEPPKAPRWFTDALAAPCEHRTVDVAGAAIHYLAWGDRTKPGLVLVHGGAAHAQWWSFIAPLLTRQYYVVAPDLSGHGGSGWRDHYPRRVSPTTSCPSSTRRRSSGLRCWSATAWEGS